jgi:hypothetical protein
MIKILARPAGSSQLRLHRLRMREEGARDVCFRPVTSVAVIQQFGRFRERSGRYAGIVNRSLVNLLDRLHRQLLHCDGFGLALFNAVRFQPIIYHQTR